MIKEKLLKIKENESKYVFGNERASKVLKYKIEIENFLDHENFKELRFVDKVKFIVDDKVDFYNHKDFKFVFEKHLIKSNNTINSAYLRNKHVRYFFKRFDIKYPKLKTYNTESKWFYLKNNLSDIPKCDGCGKYLKNFVNNRFCTQLCAVTSQEARDRTSKQFKGIKLSDKRREQGRLRMIKLWKTDKHRDNVIPKLKEANKGNGKHFLDENNRPWNFGIPTDKKTIEKAKETKRRNGVDMKGRNNPAFGKSPPPKAGRGINGRYNDVWFRSSLELFFLMYFYENKINFMSAETSEFRVEYYNSKNEIHTYSPDIYLIDDDFIIEIKPASRIKEDIFQRKMKALKEKFGDNKCGFKSELDIKEFIKKITFNKILNEIEDGRLEMSEKQEKRLLTKFKGIIDEYKRSI